MPNKILQRVQRLLEKGQCQGFPIPIWRDWPETKQRQEEEKVNKNQRKNSSYELAKTISVVFNFFF